MNGIEVSAVPKELVPQTWPKVEKYIADAVVYSSGKYELEDVLSLIMEYNYPMWVAFDDEYDIKGVVVTRFIDYPRKRYLSLEVCGGKEGFTWKEPMLDILRRWAKDNNCAGIEAHGRDGWERIFRSDGYTSPMRYFELSLD